MQTKTCADILSPSWSIIIKILIIFCRELSFGLKSFSGNIELTACAQTAQLWLDIDGWSILFPSQRSDKLLELWEQTAEEDCGKIIPANIDEKMLSRKSP